MTKEKKITILENQAFKQEEDNKGYNKVFNVFWVIFVGFFSLIENAVIGALLCCTIVGIPAGISCFKIIPLVFKPAGRRVQINFKKHPVLNVLSFTFGGVINFIYYSLIGGLLCLTIIGIPLGRQLFKVAKFYLAPFGSEIHLDGTYTQDKDTAYDMALLMHKVYKSPDRLVKLSDGREVKAIDAIKETSKNLQKKELLMYHLFLMLKTQILEMVVI